MSETTWVMIVLWLSCLILSQFIRSDETTRGGFMAFGSLFGFTLTLDFLTSGETLVGLIMMVMNLYILYEALDRW